MFTLTSLLGARIFVYEASAILGRLDKLFRNPDFLLIGSQVVTPVLNLGVVEKNVFNHSVRSSLNNCTRHRVFTVRKLHPPLLEASSTHSSFSHSSNAFQIYGKFRCISKLGINQIDINFVIVTSVRVESSYVGCSIVLRRYFVNISTM